MTIVTILRSRGRAIPGQASRWWAVFTCVAPLAVLASVPCRLAHGRPPNIVFILADDLGYAELGCFGQSKIKTPHIDRLAAEGLRFTQHYCGNAVCAPSRCVLMTGKHPGHAYVRSNRRASHPKEFLRKYGLEFQGQEPIPDRELTVAEVLKGKGYATAAIGKWGLGQIGTSGDPNRQGFDWFFGYNCQGHAHSYYPAHLWRNHEKVLLKNEPPIPGHGRLAPGSDPDDPASYAPFKGSDFAPDRMIDFALQFIRDNRDRPFFLYFPSTIPHLALHIPDDELKPYLGKWKETPFTGNGYTPHRTPRAAYAAMISRLDKDVGRIMSLLRELGIDEQTLVLFSSDNGTTHLKREVDYEFFESVGPLRGLKGSLYEGGIRVPMIARWPGKIAAGGTTEHVSAFWDVLPTLAEVAGAEVPSGIDGISFLPTLLGRGAVQRVHEFLYWEFPSYGGQQAVRMGKWKGVRQGMLRRGRRGGRGRQEKVDRLRIELYDLASDISESHDVAAEHPEIVEKIRKIMQREHIPSRVFPFPPID